jgi:mono/diheme cytochrome c family protein
MRVVEMLQDVTLTDGLRAFATETVPFGLWVEKPECRLSSAPTVASFDDARPLWMDELGLTSAADSQRPLYMVSPGEAVFTAICANCHGTQADAGGRQAKMLAEMTGGSARVANLRDGLFGSSNRERVFGDVPWNGRPTAASDWSARYLAWMALGGTRQTIPASILAIVANTRVMGKMRPRGSGAIPADANMLATAKNLCLSLLPGPSVGAIKSNIMMQLFAGETAQTALALIPENGDAELWMRLCSLDNPHPVWALSWSGSGSSAGWFHQGYYPRALYPSSAPVMDARGQLRAGMTEDNGFPWCAIKPLNLASLAEATAALERAPGASGAELPFCPEALTSTAQLTDQDKEDWATRGAINAGLAAYVHVDRLASGMAQPSTPYDHCELLEP